MKFVFAAYRKGALASMGEHFATTDLNGAEFREVFEMEIFENYHACWTLFAKSKEGFGPVGLVLGFWSHVNPEKAPFMIVGDMIWFPWASARNRVESAVNFFNVIRHEIPMVEYAAPKDKGFFVMLMRHGIMRRVGTSVNVYQNEPATVFETQKVQN